MPDAMADPTTPPENRLPGSFDDTRIWIFDLDNTLYPAACNLFAEVDHRMGAFIQKFLGVPYPYARHLQKAYYRQFGTTLSGMMQVHKMDPKAFLDYVHDIDLSAVTENMELREAIAALPGRKLIFTNGTVAHAGKVLARLGITHHFGDIFDIVHSDFIPKPDMEPYRKFVAATGINPETSAMFEDIARNLEAPHALGMTTVLVTSPENHDADKLNSASGGIDQPHVHHVTSDLAGFLKAITVSKPSL